MDLRSDLLLLAQQWLGTRGLLGLFLAALTTALRWLLGFDHAPKQLALSFAAALFVIAFVAPGVSELLGLGRAGASMRGTDAYRRAGNHRSEEPYKTIKPDQRSSWPALTEPLLASSSTCPSANAICSSVKRFFGIGAFLPSEDHARNLAS